jgi:hypothetical protein
VKWTEGRIVTGQALRALVNRIRAHWSMGSQENSFEFESWMLLTELRGTSISLSRHVKIPLGKREDL